jgi:hypothetical protein
MGLNFLGSNSTYDDDRCTSPAEININDTPPDCSRGVSPMPDPNNYKIKKHKEIGKNLLIEIQYLDCTNYEGNKILLYKDLSFDQLKAQVLIDPHFSENPNYKSPAARFEPTDAGWKMGVSCLHCEFWFN